jgi:hypothetical protein
MFKFQLGRQQTASAGPVGTLTVLKLCWCSTYNPRYLSCTHLIFIEYIFTIGVGFIMSVTNALMRRGAELVATRLEEQR